MTNMITKREGTTEMIKNVINQLDWLEGRDYSFYDGKIYNQMPQKVAVYKADVNRLLDEVDWTDAGAKIDTDAMQIALNNAVNNYSDFGTLQSIVEHEIISPITEWATIS